VIGIVVQVMAVVDLGRAAMAAPVVRDNAKAAFQEEQHLRVPIVGRQRPAMAEHDRLTLAPVLVEDFDSVFGGYRAHRLRSVACNAGRSRRESRGTLNASLVRTRVGRMSRPARSVSDDNEGLPMQYGLRGGGGTVGDR